MEPKGIGLQNVFTIGSFSIRIYQRPGCWRSEGTRQRRAGAPSRHRKTLTDMISAQPEIVAGKGVAPEAIRRIGV
jgi:hypothetical protein